MTVHTRPALPSGHGELLERPAYAEWVQLIGRNVAATMSWDFEVAGMSATALRELARRECLEVGERFSARMGVPVRAVSPDAVIVATGHQPELYHPGVWVKDFLLQRLAEEHDANAIDFVVDSDGFEVVAVSSPCLTPGVARCQQYLAVGAEGQAFSQASVPTVDELDTFISAAEEMLATLPAPAIGRHFSVFGEKLREAALGAQNLAELLTFARRRYEASAGTDYLEAPVTHVAATEAFARFVVDLAFDAERFAEAYNAELEEFRALTKTRSAAQPFPNLSISETAVELPLWYIGDGGRHSVYAVRGEEGVRLRADGSLLLDLGADPESAASAVLATDLGIAPKALALTLFTRMFCCDLFIHGVGGGRYDRVTDGVVRRYYCVEPPAFVVASMTVYLPLGAHVVSTEEVSAAKERLNRLEHNPDALLAEVEFDSAEEQTQAMFLASEKGDLVALIAAPDADKKTLGARIREVNAQLSMVLAPLRQQFEEELAALETQFAASEILTDRTYPYCFWAPEEIADKVR